jgi:hypothetical protein
METFKRIPYLIAAPNGQVEDQETGGIDLTVVEAAPVVPLPQHRRPARQPCAVLRTLCEQKDLGFPMVGVSRYPTVYTPDGAEDQSDAVTTVVFFTWATGRWPTRGRCCWWRTWCCGWEYGILRIYTRKRV